jgi:hypothetical protein
MRHSRRQPSDLLLGDRGATHQHCLGQAGWFTSTQERHAEQGAPSGIGETGAPSGINETGAPSGIEKTAPSGDRGDRMFSMDRTE